MRWLVRRTVRGRLPDAADRYVDVRVRDALHELVRFSPGTFLTLLAFLAEELWRRARGGHRGPR
ncbi:hypothetical protein ACFXKY_24190 [Streptomyces canus]|uniref:hypothetical protein n=1 Tax=Streptomyces canus TaxID=58343 RepID=UPI0036862218